MNAKRIFLLPVAILVAAMVLNTGCKKTETVIETRTIRDTVIVPPTKQYVQVERMGIPALNTVLITGDANKDAYNQADPKNDVASYRQVAINRINTLRSAVGAVSGFPPEDNPGISAAALVDILIPDVVTINFANALVFPNGRQLNDDVIDVALKLVLNRNISAITDGVNANDKTFLSTFPYLAEPNVPPLARPSGN